MGISGLLSIDWLNSGRLWDFIRKSDCQPPFCYFERHAASLEMTGSRLADRHYEFLWTQYSIFIEPVRISDRFVGAMQKKSRQL
jgi:hypothetical protein